MNRFRQLKDRLIKSKRDSQKLEQSPFSETELEDWVQKQLEYYGINKDSYRLRQLRNFSQTNANSQQIIKQNPQMQSSKDTFVEINKKNNAFAKKICKISQSQSTNNIYRGSTSFGHLISENSKESRQSELQQQRIHQLSSQSSSKRLVCKKPKNYHVSSMNDAEKLIQASGKSKDTQIQNPDKHTKNMFKSFQPQKDQNQRSSPRKQLDYYTLILQLTAELNYSRINKQTANEKSILNQIKNLISFIQGKSATQPGTEPSAQQSSNQKNNLNSQQSHHHTNIKSNHTFSSVFSNQSIANEIDQYKSIGSSEKRKIKYKLIERQKINENEGSNNLLCTEPISSQRNQNHDEHNDTFQSVNAFEENDGSSDEEEKTSIIDMVNDPDCHEYRDDIFIQQSDDHNDSVAKENLFMITQRESQYSPSANPSIQVSPSKYTAQISGQANEKLERQFLPHMMEKHIQLLYAQNIFKKKSSQNQFFGKNSKILPQNQIILKKLSDRFDNSDEPLHLFEQSIEYKRILYMLDSQYGNSDYKNRTFSSLFGQKSSSATNQIGSDKESYQYSVKGASQESAKSFRREIFESDESCTKQNHVRQSPCLMSKLDNLFKAQCQKDSASPKLLHFSSGSEIDSKCNDAKSPLTKNHHKRSHTTKDPFSSKPMQKTIKYKFNILSELSQQIYEQSQENAFDNNKYEPMRTQYNEDQSVYHKVSRQSYLTSSSVQNSNEPTSSEGEGMEGQKKLMKKGNLIVKKQNKSVKFQKSQKQNINSLTIHPSDQEKPSKEMKFIVKKNPDQKRGHINSQDNLFQKIQNDSVDLFSKTSQDNQVIFISMSEEPTARINIKEPKSIKSHKSSASSEFSNQKKDQEKGQANQKIRSPSLNDSKVSINSSNRPIKYKVYAGPSQCQSNQQKEDKRKVLKDIVSVLNSKYNRNIKLKD